MVKDNIIQIDSRKSFMENMARYSLYVLYNRYIPDIRDGLKPVQRRILYAMWNDIGCVSVNTKRKSANTVGTVIAKYHCHGDCIRGNTGVYALDGSITPIKTLYECGCTTFEALGVNEASGHIEPIIAHDLRIGQYTNKVYHIGLSNGAEIQCTANHPFMVKTGEYIKAEDIVPGVVLYTANMKMNTHNRPAFGTNMIQDIVWNYYNGPIEAGFVKHHVDGNVYNNTIGNLQKLSRADHAKLHNDYNKGLDAGRISMKDPTTFAYINNKMKNQRLMRLYTKDQNFRRFKLYINQLIESGIPVTEENYEKLRPTVYNLPKISTLIKNGYGNNFEELCTKELPTISELYAAEVSKLVEMAIIIEPKTAREYYTLSPVVNSVYDSIEKMIMHGITPSYYNYYTGNIYKHTNVTEYEYNELYNNFCMDRPFVTRVWVEEVDNEPMYDFTVDTTHNMLFPVIGANTDNGLPFVCLHNSSVYDAMKVLTNWFEIKMPLLVYDSNSGSIQGGPQAAMRYTESCLSKFAMDCVIGELQESRQVVDWEKTFDNHTVEPECMPVQVPMLLVNGVFSIAIGRKIEVPKHSLNDVIDATLAVLHNPNAKVILIPDPCQKCEIVDTDWKKISNTGYGYYTQRGIIAIEHCKDGHDILHLRSMPDLVFSDSVMAKIEDLIKDKKLIGITDIQDHSTDDQLDIWLILKKGADSNYVKQVLYKNTTIQDEKRVNMEVIDGTEVKRISYKAYIAYFLEYRRMVKFRLYNARLQKVETRLHQIDTYIKILESGDVENIVHMIRNQSSMDEAYLIDWLMKKLKITDLQAKFVLHTEIGRLSKGHLNKYKTEQKNLLDLSNQYKAIITNDKLINAEIEQELLAIKAKYGKPRQSILISEADASDIPAGEFKVVITEQNFVKKMQVNEPIRAFKGDHPKCITIADNAKDLLLFDQMGKVFRLPVHKIAFTDKSSPGIDIRLLVKKLTSNIISTMYVPIIETLANKSSKYFIVTVTKNGLIKRMDLEDVINATPSGIIYSKLNPNDMVCDILIANMKSDIIVYTKSKALRMPLESIPYLKRATLGNQCMKTSEEIDGISVVTSDTKEVIVVTAKGRFNKLTTSALPRSDRNKAGCKVIKLSKGDYIKNIFSCSKDAKIRITRVDEVVEIDTASIPIGSSVSAGTKLCKDGVIKAEMIRL